jgi:hypothetical protein
MRAVLSKVDAAEAKHHAGLRESAWRDKQEAKAKPLRSAAPDLVHREGESQAGREEADAVVVVPGPRSN